MARYLALTPRAEALMPELLEIGREVNDALLEGISDEDRAAFLRGGQGDCWGRLLT